MAKLITEVLKPSELKYLLIDSLKSYTDAVEFISGNNPYEFSINDEHVHIFIHNLHSTGRNRNNPDESRIQINRSAAFTKAKDSGKKMFFLGYYTAEQVFTAWDPTALIPRVNIRKVISVYSRFSTQSRAAVQGIAIYKDKAGNSTISFVPKHIGLYFENFRAMHSSDEATLLELLYRAEEKGETPDKGVEVAVDKKKFTVTHTKYARDPKFRLIVAEQYESRCAMCDIHLDLVEAAHIVPHAHDMGTDEPSNGIALCPLHHAAYDSGLIYFDEKYDIHLNKERVSYLEKTRQDGGIKKFESLHNARLAIPRAKLFQPDVDLIRIANRIRGIL